MRKIIIIALLLFTAALAFAQGNYYNAVLNLTGNQLYTALHSLISTNHNSSYDGSKTEMFQEVDNVNGTVRCIYTGQVYTISSTYNGSNDPNTEHTYAQSWFSSPESSIKKADIHHLFPSNSVVNSSRGNLPLSAVTNHSTANVYYTYTPWQSFRGGTVGGYTVFEPCNQSKGDIARALLYFNTRYYDTLTQQNVDMIPTLVQWHNFDPPDATEIARNTAIFNFQTNRNPYVDHPEFVGRIWGGTAIDDEVTPSVENLTLSSVYPNPFRGSTTLSLQSKVASNADISVFNIKGRKLRSWTQTLPQGTTEISWNGTDSNSRQLPAGIYLIRISTQENTVTAKVLMN